MNELDKAISDCDEAIRINPRYVPAYIDRGRMWTGEQHYGKAIKDFDEAIRLDPKNASAHFERALACLGMKEYGKATKDFEQALRLDPKKADVHDSFAWLLATCPEATIRDGKRAVKLATTACELSVWKNNNALNTLAAAYAEAGQFDEAVRYQTKALEDPALRGPDGDEFRQRLELYKQKKPYRQMP